MEDNIYHVFVDPEADQRLAEHMEFIAKVSEKAALKLFDAYKDALEFLECYPESCSLYYPQIPINEELRYKLFYKRYRIVFEIIKNEVYIYDIQDCRQDDDKNLI